MRGVLLLLSLLLPGAALCAPAAAAAAPAAPVQVQPGDLLFVTAARTGLSGAINEATARADAPSFDHVGLVADGTDGPAVLHADEQGSREQPLPAFLAEARARARQVIVYRLVPAQRATIPQAIATARTLLGKPYNATYLQSEDSLYCSDFVERAFRADAVFALQPMNFRNPQTGEMPAYWTAFFERHGMPVPQGAPGTNPNDMAAAPVLQRVGELR